MTEFKAYFLLIKSKQCPMKQMQLLLPLAVISLTMSYIMCCKNLNLYCLYKKVVLSCLRVCYLCEK